MSVHISIYMYKKVLAYFLFFLGGGGGGVKILNSNNWGEGYSEKIIFLGWGGGGYSQFFLLHRLGLTIYCLSWTILGGHFYAGVEGAVSPYVGLGPASTVPLFIPPPPPPPSK